MAAEELGFAEFYAEQYGRLHRLGYSIVPAVFRKLDAVAVLTARLLPAP